MTATNDRDDTLVVSVDQLCQHLSAIAPLRLAESWDNVGLLVGDRNRHAGRVMTCLTLTPAVVDEAVTEKVDLIIAHHPMPFKPLARITSDSITGGMLLQLIQAGVAVYSAHTAFDSAANGINQDWAERLELHEIRPLIDPTADLASAPTATFEVKDGAAGRYGLWDPPSSFGELTRRAADVCSADNVRRIGSPDKAITRVAIACGSGGSFLSAAKRKGCDAMVTGEATFHTCLEAESLGIGLILVGHYQSERFAMDRLAKTLSREFPALVVWASDQESDPIECLNGLRANGDENR
ncbi:Nif3-like dinuclear metal center hexameric protein [Novipirellula artificiosorum]|uniref:GTP cyclohydrolase 1 type 2 homolog n=1 Tax=Novipirellula artificiosorum TaxID=2528016 RepID=A0A5C6DNH0_9BACT|nr:Nif3-like dinuclear metal center hexameric protein [Novipirellula artificiosorum]TWU37417.1 GTP cyclohydrolase 1 type 2 [Novipirellula artificiosorum]